MARELKPDLCVIGAGAGGLAVAAAAAAFGVTVVLIEKGRMGGENLNTGAVPATALSAVAQRIKAMRRGPCPGVKAARFGVDFAAVNGYVHDAIEALAPQDSRERFAGLGVHVLEGVARFADPRTVLVGDSTIRARRFVIATGSSPTVPAIPGLAETPHVTNETVFDLRECPRHLIVIGANSVGLELAQTFRRLGAEVTVLESSTALAANDPECAAVVLDALVREGIKLYTAIKITRVRQVLARISIDIVTPAGPSTIEGTDLLVTAGRRPNLEQLGLEAAGIRYEPHGIAVDKRLRTSNKRVYAIGDVIPGPKFTHVANYHAELVVRRALFRQRVEIDHHRIPAVTYTDPQLAQVGLLEHEARAHAGAIRVLRWPYRGNSRAQAERATNGHIKIVTDRQGGILGATIVGAEAGEIIATWTLAISQKLNIRALAGLIVPYPSYAEVGKRAAMTYFMGDLTSSRVRRIIGWLRRLG